MTEKYDGVVRFYDNSHDSRIHENGATSLNKRDLVEVGYAVVDRSLRGDRDPTLNLQSATNSADIQISIQQQFRTSSRAVIQGHAIIRDPSGEVRSGDFSASHMLTPELNDGVVKFTQGGHQARVSEDGETSLTRSDLLALGSAVVQHSRNGNTNADLDIVSGRLKAVVQLTEHFTAGSIRVIEGYATVTEPSGEVRHGNFNTSYKLSPNP